MAARLLKVQSELGKQLDSLADLVTSGVAPGFIIYKLLEVSSGEFFISGEDWLESYYLNGETLYYNFLPVCGLLLTLGAAYRLANFNIDTRQTSSFIGLPTPAMTLLVVSLPLIHKYNSESIISNLIENKYVLIAIAVLGCILMNANIKLFALKFNNFSFKENWVVYVFLLVSIILLLVLQFVAVPIIILLYVVVSLVLNFVKK